MKIHVLLPSLAAFLMSLSTSAHAQTPGQVLAPAAPRAAASIEVPATPAALLQTRGGLKNVFARLEAKQPVTIAYLGGSITAGAGSSKEENSYRALTTRWFREQFPDVKITEVNAAIGGTGSDLGVFRVRRDVLEAKPDLLFVEFAVNDGGAAPAQILRAMEGIVRQTRRELPNCDIAFVYTYIAGFQGELAKGTLVRSMAADEIVAAHYGIASINVALPIAERVAARTMISSPARDAEGKELPLAPGVELFANDGVHPRDPAMKIYADTITGAMAALRQTGTAGPHALPAPLASDNWEDAKMAPIEASMLSPDWKELPVDSGLGQQFSKYLPRLWQGSAGDTLSFKFRGRAAKLFDLVGPDGGQLWITIDGKKNPKPTPRFDSYASYHRLQTLGLFEGADGLHEIKIEIDAAQPDRTSVTDKEKDKPNFDPKKYDGTFARVGWILLLGEIEK